MSTATNTPTASAVAAPLLVTTPSIQTLLVNEEQLFAIPFNAFLTALQQPGVNYQAAVQDFAQLQLAALGKEPAAQSVLIQGTAASLQAKLPAIAPGLVLLPALATSGGEA